MPIYEYECESCNKKLDVIQKTTDKPLIKCPECGKLSLVKVIASNCSFVLKGGGWFKDGYK